MKNFIKYAKQIFQVGSGNFLEMYDYMIFGLYASIIAKVFFPNENHFISIVYAFGVFAAGAFMRPIGAIVLGGYIDKFGRKKGLIMTLGLMSIGTISIAFCPSYEQIGIIAPIIVLIGRLIQGFSAGAELGGVSIYLSEIAPKGLKGFFVAWQSGSQQIATAFATGIGVILHYYFSDAMMESWGWRIPFFIGCLVIPFIFYIRRTLEETPEFAKNQAHQIKKTFGALLKNVFQNFGTIIVGIMLVMTTTVFYYFISVYTPTYAKEVLNFSRIESFGVTVIISLSNLFWLLVSGYMSDRIGRKKVLFTASLLGIFISYPLLIYLTNNISFTNLILVELALSLVYGVWNGTMTVTLSEIMPSSVKAMGFSFSYSVAVAVFGGLTPAVSTFLIEVTQNRAIPGIWLTCVACISFVAVLIIRKKIS
ncbi:tricarballylate/proton symporter TcuC [Helicobacter anatolicus]|uniref:tricarballylate/proton symporter TcuC n=1 Tax=Helicobacter anatolicus TaxID=2905874 RepID=UPI001E65CF87|nr:tricarballylate/proton symporter TcuC [Helicobacter anatolicus]MCE3038483.1 tricarballylate/proton symporter TcuC [Helicobacter anatolicus]